VSPVHEKPYVPTTLTCQSLAGMFTWRSGCASRLFTLSLIARPWPVMSENGGPLEALAWVPGSPGVLRTVHGFFGGLGVWGERVCRLMLKGCCG
jgi:hypothetical protein